MPWQICSRRRNDAEFRSGDEIRYDFTVGATFGRPSKQFGISFGGTAVLYSLPPRGNPQADAGDREAVEGACVTKWSRHSHCNAFSPTRLRREPPPGGGLAQRRNNAANCSLAGDSCRACSEIAPTGIVHNAVGRGRICLGKYAPAAETMPNFVRVTKYDTISP